jgi:DNA-binding response OmpR family regulator
VVTSIPDERDLFAEAYSAAGFDVRAFTFEAPIENVVRQITTDAIDLVLTRFRPNQLGVRLTAALRQHPLTATVPIVVVTTHMDAEQRALAREAGADEVVLLPVTPDELVRTTRNLLKHRSGDGPRSLPRSSASPRD